MASSPPPERPIGESVKGLEKLTAIRLAEVLSQKGVVPTDAITDALYTQDQYGEPFAEVLVTAGHISEWDLARVVVESFQLPFLLASNYEISVEAKEVLPQQVLFEHLLVPLGRFDPVVTVAMPILTPFETLDKIRQDHDCEIFPYVGLISENRTALGTLFADFGKWYEVQEAKRNQYRAEKKDRASNAWMDIFDSADAAIRQGMGRGR